MKILHIISSGGMYGAEAVILSLMAELNASEDHACALGVFHQPGSSPPALYDAALQRGAEPEQVHLLPCSGQLDFKVPSRLRVLAEQMRADVVHTHGYKADVYASFAWRGARPTLVSTCHTWYDNDLSLRIYGAVDRYVLRGFDGVVAVSEEVRQRLLGARVVPSRIRLIRNGVNTQTFAAADEVRDGRGDRNPLNIGLVGRFAPEKGIDIFLRAAALVAQRHPEVSFFVAGDGPETEALQRLTNELGLQERVTLLGRQEDMPAFYAGLDLLVSASRQEGLPVALLEGMASGLAVVATKVGAVDQVVADGATGLLVEPNSPVALAGAIAQCITRPDLRKRFGAAGQDRVHREFSGVRMAAEYIAFYSESAAHSGTVAAGPLSQA